MDQKIPTDLQLNANDISVMRTSLVTYMRVLEAFITKSNNPEQSPRVPESETSIAESQLKHTIKLLERFTPLEQIVSLLRDSSDWPHFEVEIKVNPRFL